MNIKISFAIRLQIAPKFKLMEYFETLVRWREVPFSLNIYSTVWLLNLNGSQKNMETTVL